MKSIAFIGHTHFSSRLEQAFRKRGHDTITLDYNDWGHQFIFSMAVVKKYEVLHFISGTGFRKFFYALILRFVFKKTLLVHFVGSDVTRIQSRKLIDKLNWMGALKLAHRVFCVAPWLTEELKSCGKSETFPLFFRNFPTKIFKMPTTFTILSYLPESRPVFYGRDIIEKLIIANPKIHFIILGGSDLEHYSNVETHPIDYETDMNQFYSRTSLLLRLTKHDGLSNMVMESLALNRQVVWTYEFPYVQKTKGNIMQVQNIISSFYHHNKPNSSSEWMRSKFNYSVFLNTLENLYENPTYSIPAEDYS